ncbi:MAG: hypothetical protein ACRD2I_00430 [Vicinamibacterales bacterium]
MRNLIDLVRATRLLVVDPDPLMRIALATAVGRSARVDSCDSFPTARARLDSTACDLLVTVARLREYNGLHLVYLAKLAHPSTRAVVYDRRIDAGFAFEVRRACAFYEAAHKITITLPTYVSASLPATDRRTPNVSDRRVHPRGGRRSWDRHLIGPLPTEESKSAPVDG